MSRMLTWGLLLSIWCSGAINAADVVDEPDAAGRAAWSRIAELGTGFVVWESNRTGNWRLWRRELNGDDLRQISPQEQGRDHYCPHISPDGRRLVYLSYPAGVNTYESGAPRGPVQLHLCDADGTHDRVLTDSARAYFEDRAAVWVNDQELVYIDHGGTTRKLQVDTGKSAALTQPVGNHYGWLMNAKLAYATTGSPSFSTYDSAKSAITIQPGLQGCQPYFSHDGVWGFWMGGAGGPINRFHLQSRQVSPILDAHDPRMPKDRNYLYFPMLSRNGRLFACAASPNQHDHFSSDYDIFLAAINPRTLELEGNPVRYSFHPGNDRFPDVYLAEFELGQPVGELPFAVDLTPPGGGEWQFHFGDGTQSQGRTGKHTYQQQGRFHVVAKQGSRSLRGVVTIEPAAPPQLLQAYLAGPQEIQVDFDEPIQPAQATSRLDSGTQITQSRLSDDQRSLRLTLAAPLVKPDVLQLSGITDRAQRPNQISPQSVAIRGASWPTNPRGLEFLYATGDQPNLIPAQPGRGSRGFSLTPRGRARWDHDQALVLTGGSFLVEAADEALLNSCKVAHELTLEAVVRPDHSHQTGPARIVTFSTSAHARNFSLAQDGDTLVLRLRTPQTGENGVNPETKLVPLTPGTAQHVAVTYRPGQIIAYVNGGEVFRTETVRGDFSNWSPQHLVLGDEFDGQRDWAGTLEGIAIFSRALTPTEIRQDATEYQRILKGRQPVVTTVVTARLLAKSDVPTLADVKPYRGALMVSKYAVQQVEQGTLSDKEILVTEWALLDGEPQPIASRQPGAVVKLTLESTDRNPQLKRYVCHDRFDNDDELLLPRYYDATP